MDSLPPEIIKEIAKWLRSRDRIALAKSFKSAYKVIIPTLVSLTLHDYNGLAADLLHLKNLTSIHLLATHPEAVIKELFAAPQLHFIGIYTDIISMDQFTEFLYKLAKHFPIFIESRERYCLYIHMCIEFLVHNSNVIQTYKENFILRAENCPEFRPIFSFHFNSINMMSIADIRVPITNILDEFVQRAHLPDIEILDDDIAFEKAANSAGSQGKSIVPLMKILYNKHINKLSIYVGFKFYLEYGMGNTLYITDMNPFTLLIDAKIHFKFIKYAKVEAWSMRSGEKLLLKLFK